MFRLTRSHFGKQGAFLKKLDGPIANRYRDSVRRRGKAINQGALNRGDYGSSFSEHGVYANRTNPDVMIRYGRKMDTIGRQRSLNRAFAAEMDDQRLDNIERSGSANTLAERKIQSRLDADTLGFGDEATEGRRKRRNYGAARTRQNHEGSVGFASESQKYTNSLHKLLTRETVAERRERVLADNSIEPSEAEFASIMNRLTAEDEEDAIAEQVQERLVEDHGIYPTMRIDAFMLGDESGFPQWVHELAPHAVRDRVKYGGMGLTEDDEALRIRLSKMPLDARRVEWERLKAAKSYAAGVKEQKLAPYEIKEARMAKRQYFRLQQQRQHRATLIRRLALRKPESVELIPSHHVDYSARMATIAQYVENGVDTKGQWPLDREEIQRAKIRNQQEDAERTFLRSTEENNMLKGSKLISATVGEALQQLDDRVPMYKRVSRKTYAHRVNNILLGANDDVGRVYRHVHRTSKVQKARSNDIEALRRRTTDEPQPNIRRHAKKVHSTKHWHNKEASFKNNYDRKPLQEF